MCARDRWFAWILPFYLTEFVCAGYNLNSGRGSLFPESTLTASVFDSGYYEPCEQIADVGWVSVYRTPINCPFHSHFGTAILPINFGNIMRITPWAQHYLSHEAPMKSFENFAFRLYWQFAAVGYLMWIFKQFVMQWQYPTWHQKSWEHCTAILFLVGITNSTYTSCWNRDASRGRSITSWWP